MRFWKTRKRREAEARAAARERLWTRWVEVQERAWRQADEMPTEMRDIYLPTFCKMSADMYGDDAEEWMIRTRHWPDHWKALDPEVWQAVQRRTR